MDLLALYATRHPDKAAVIDDRPGEPVLSWSYAELDRRANQLGHYLVGLGVDPATKVVWCGQNSAALVLATHAIRKVGAVGVPLNYRLAPDEAAYVIDNSDAQVVYVDAEYAGADLAGRATGSRRSATCWFSMATATSSASWESVRRQRLCFRGPTTTYAAATMIYTSGTTGKPKGALRSRPMASSTAAGLVKLIGYVPDDVYLTTGPLYHSGPSGFAAVAFALGNTVVVQRKFDPEDWLRLLQTYRVTTTFTAPTPIRMVCTLPAEVKDRYDRSSMRRLDRQRRPVDAGAEEDVPGRLPARLAVGGVRVDRARRRHRVAPGGSPAEAGIVWTAGPGRRDQAV